LAALQSAYFFAQPGITIFKVRRINSEAKSPTLDATGAAFFSIKS